MKRFYILTMLIAIMAISKLSSAQVSCNASFYLDLSASTLFNGVIVNTSTSTGIAPPDQMVYVWSWGDGTSTWGVQFPTHTYSSPGSKTIKLDVFNAFKSCHDSDIHIVTIDTLGGFHKTNGTYTLSVVAPAAAGVKTVSAAGFAHLSSALVNDYASFSFNGINEGEMVSARIFASNGQMISSTEQNITGNTLRVPTATLQSGMYIASLNINGRTMTAKFIKQ